MDHISTTSSSTQLTPLNEDCLGNVIKYIDIPGICSLLQTNREFTMHVEKYSRENKPIIPLKRLPSNSKLFENI